MHIVVFVTASNKKEAVKIAQGLIEKKLAACVNIIERIESFFRWKGKAERSSETLLIIKSQKKMLDKIIRHVKSAHSYEVPEIIALPITGADKNYLRWIDESVG